MKKLIALALAGAMVFAMPVMAAESPSAGASSPAASAVTAPVAAPAPAVTVAAEAVPAAVVAAAEAEGKTVGEYMNNAVVSVPGLENVTPLGQGGHVIINGAPSNQVFSVLKPTAASVASAKAFAASLGGRVMNVAQIKASVTGFNTATVNFYMKGVKAGQTIKVYQLVNGQWVELTVAEIREDHVVVDMTSLGTLAFIAL
ncbi:MAG: hypothetical protein NC416_06545 [Eubacterium sp.]|nr:hypothetical protein [Eubacterium sp.]